ncbi:MAG: DegV family EDD domain-containing protein [Deltaproteobacteria bacterium]|nr:DegV family EDD domain-containing protein [Deltaproteobacteria bacterium]
MDRDIQKGLILGVERIAAWSDLLDEINVFPVADGDTGRNLITSLVPLKHPDKDRQNTIRRLLFSARGNSGNIAARFLSGLLTADSVDILPRAARLGRDRAWKAINAPVPGTMLNVFDALVEIIQQYDFNDSKDVSNVIGHLEKAVRSTPDLLPRLRDAGVVDSGALGMFIFLEGFLKSLAGKADHFQPVTSIFKGLLQVSSAFREHREEGYCIDLVVRSDDKSSEGIQRLSQYGNEVVVIPHQDIVKVHLHAGDRDEARKGLESFCDIVQWTDDDLGKQISRFRKSDAHRCIHIMTDAAGSITREDSRELGITLLDSYITAGDRCLPETLFPPEDIYKAMRKGLKVSTSQASVFERHQHYQSVLNQHDRILYLCVGSVFTGNYDVAMEWKEKNDPDDRLTVIDTTSASGRLGTIVMAVERHSSGTDDPDSVIEFAKTAVDKCEEYVFLDRLQYLAAGGRLSRSSAFFGDLLHMKPVISPMAGGAKKVGVVRNQKDQIGFALDRLKESLSKNSPVLIMLQYSDNRSRVRDTVMKEIESHYPLATIILQPLSLTSGVHMGPGTWSMAFIPDL